MPFFQTRDVLSNDAMNLVEELGGKAGLLEFVRDKVPGLADAIVSGEFFGANTRDDTILGFKHNQRQGNQEFLVRSSHPDDITAYIGRLPTTSLQRFDSDVFLSPNLNSYAQRLGILGPEHTGILVVPKKDLAFRGNIVEHPNQPGVYIISEAFETYDGQTLCTSSIRGNNGEQKAQSYIQPSVDEEAARKIIHYYIQSRESGWLNDDMSGQMEFGIDRRTGKIYIFQFRAFRKKEVVNWKNIKGGHPYVFGITPEEGEDFSLVSINGGDFQEIQEGQEGQGIFRLNNYGSIHSEIPLERLGLFISSPRNALSLEHDVYEACMYTRIAVLGYPSFDERTTSIPTYIRVVSDGRTVEIQDNNEEELTLDVLLGVLGGI